MSPPHRRAGGALTAFSAAAIAWLTLRPQPVVPSVSLGHGCLVCGSIGGADVLANVALFAPLGFGLALLGLRWWVVAAVGAAASGAIELAQVFAVAGRFATLSDLVTNTLGTAVGATLAVWRGAWLRPRPRAAAWLATAAGTLWLVALGGATWALGRDPDTADAPPAVSALPFAPGFGWFGGHVREARLDAFRVPHVGTGPVIVSAPARPSVRASVVVEGRDDRDATRPMLFVHGPGEVAAHLVIAQRGDHAIFSVRLRSRRLRLRQPSAIVTDVFGPETPRDMRFTVVAAAEADSLSLAVQREGGGEVRRSVLRLTPTLGWALLSPIPLVGTPAARLATALWLAGLALPLGYWARRATAGVGRTGQAIGAGLAAATVTAGLLTFPRLGGLAIATPSEIVAAFAGLGAGALAARIVARRSERGRPAP